MDEHLTQTSDSDGQQSDFDRRVEEVLAQNRALHANRDTFMRQAAATAQQYAETREQIHEAVGGAVKDTLLLGGLAVGAVILGAGFANATEYQANHVIEQNQQWHDEAEENLRRSEFENGLEKGKVTIEMPHDTPETTIPSPTQSNDPNIQLPTLPSPDTH